jgi:DNA mismatch repair protein MSH6
MAPSIPKAAATAAVTNGSRGAKNLKQGNLFSFFTTSRKSSATTKPSSPSVPLESTNAPVPGDTKPSTDATTHSPKSTTKRPLTPPLRVGDVLQVYWPDDKAYYQGTLVQIRRATSAPLHCIDYGDGQAPEWIDLNTTQYQRVSNDNQQQNIDNNNNRNQHKRRRIPEPDEPDEEAEFEFSGDLEEPESCADEDDESAYEQDEQNDNDDENEDQWMVTDDEDEAPRKPKRHSVSSRRPSLSKSRPTPSVTVTAHPPAAPHQTPARPDVSTTPSGPKRNPPHVTPSLAGASLATNTQPYPSPSLAATPSPTHATQTKGKPPMFEKGVVNIAGSHAHNHLPFLQNPRDAQGRTPDHPDYDRRTLKVNSRDWLNVTGGNMTDAVQQWWDLKARYADTVLLFKTGKFYEMFHADADVGVQVCGLLYMKGHVAHAGFPEISYGPMADQLVRAGYKVARVEQTETPDALAVRKKAHHRRNGPAPKVVNREVCSILTLGTRTFGYLDDDTHIATGQGGVGPLLAIRETLVDQGERQDDVEVEVQQAPVCEYGITLVDAVHGIVTIGQFADDVRRSRMDTLLTNFAPSEILVEGGPNGASDTLLSLIRTAQKTSLQSTRLEIIRATEQFPQSTALDPEIRRKLDRPLSQIHPWDVSETLDELHRRRYYPRASKQQTDHVSVSRWPAVLRAAVEGGATLALSSFGAVLFYLQRNLVDGELLSMGVVKAYIPPSSSTVTEESPSRIQTMAERDSWSEAGVDIDDPRTTAPLSTKTSSNVTQATQDPVPMQFEMVEAINIEDDINHMALDGTTLHNLEILYNSVDHKANGSLWSKINLTKTPHGSRLLRAWLLRPLFRRADIDRRADAVQELVSGGAGMALSEARSVLAKCGDIERLLSRVHSMSGMTRIPGEEDDADDGSSYYPSDRAVLYETSTYTKRKVGDFSKVLKGLQHATQIPELFDGIEIQSGLLSKIVRFTDQGGCFPNMIQELEWFFENFDLDQAAKGFFEPSRGIDDLYDQACDAIAHIQSELNDYKEEMCSTYLQPRSAARSSWKYINTKPESKEKYTIELPASVRVPDNFILKGKRGSGTKQMNRYRTAQLEHFVQEFENAYEVQKKRKARGMQLIFAKFDSMRSLWAAAAQATSLLDAIGALAQTASKPGYTRAKILDCPQHASPTIRVTGGRHPCIESSIGSNDFIPNDLSLGTETSQDNASRVLLLSGPNMGGKSTLLRQTCLISILAQIGCFVPAEDCALTPIDRIYTRLGATDRILLGQSTFFVELAETAAALRGATRRSLVIMDELGRGTSTFDGTAIASSVVKHLVDRSKCLSLFATHYHSLLEEWKHNRNVRLGHMECIVENGITTSRPENEEKDESTITFLYTLGEGVCPKSFGINVARLAGLPEDVLSNAKRISSEFEQEVNGNGSSSFTPCNGVVRRSHITKAIEAGDWAKVSDLWQSLQV